MTSRNGSASRMPSQKARRIEASGMGHCPPGSASSIVPPRRRPTECGKCPATDRPRRPGRPAGRRDDTAMIAGVILAGGRATRMGGGDKGLLLLGGRPILARVIERLAPAGRPPRAQRQRRPRPLRRLRPPRPPRQRRRLPRPARRRPRRHGLGGGGGRRGPRHRRRRHAVLAPRPRGAPPGRRTLRHGRHPRRGRPRAPPHLRPLAGRRSATTCAPPSPPAPRKVVAWTDPRGCATVAFPDPDAFFNVNTPDDLARAEAVARALA